MRTLRPAGALPSLGTTQVSTSLLCKPSRLSVCRNPHRHVSVCTYNDKGRREFDLPPNLEAPSAREDLQGAQEEVSKLRLAVGCPARNSFDRLIQRGSCFFPDDDAQDSQDLRASTSYSATSSSTSSSTPSSLSPPSSVPYSLVAGLAGAGALETAYLTWVRLCVCVCVCVC